MFFGIGELFIIALVLAIVAGLIAVPVIIMRSSRKSAHGAAGSVHAGVATHVSPGEPCAGCAQPIERPVQASRCPTCQQALHISCAVVHSASAHGPGS